MCFVEVIDTAGQGTSAHPSSAFRDSMSWPLRRGVRNTPGSMGPVRVVLFGYGSRSSTFRREGQGFILVYSITSRSTFNRLEVFHQSVRRAKRGNPILLLVGNKCDRPLDREVSRKEGAALARQFGCNFFETSAKTGLNVERVFTALVRELRPTKAISAVAESAKDAKKKCIIL